MGDKKETDFLHLFYYYDKQPHTPHPKRHHRIFRGPTVHRCPTTCAKKHTKGKNVKKEIQSPLNTATLHTFTRNHGFFHRHGTLEHSRRAIPVDASRLDVRVWRATRVVFGQLYALLFLFFSFFLVFNAHRGICVGLLSQNGSRTRCARETPIRTLDAHSDPHFSSQTTQLTQFSAVSGQFKNRTVAKVCFFALVFHHRLCAFLRETRKGQGNERPRMKEKNSEITRSESIGHRERL